MGKITDKETIASLRLSIKEALDSLGDEPSQLEVAMARSILEAAHMHTDPELFIKDCGCP